MDDGPLPRTIAAFMRRLRQSLQPLSPVPGWPPMVTLGVAWGLVMHQVGWAQLAHFDQVQAFSKGQPQIDQWHWNTNDKAWVDGHFYSVKSPGMAALTTPLYEAIEGLGGDKLARAAAHNVDRTTHPKWRYDGVIPIENFGYNVERGQVVQASIERLTPIIWALTLLGAVIPAVLLLLAVRWAADRFVPGYGTAAAITFGVGTVAMTFAAEFFSHVISAGLASRRSAADEGARRTSGPGWSRGRPARRARRDLRVPDRAGRVSCSATRSPAEQIGCGAELRTRAGRSPARCRCSRSISGPSATRSSSPMATPSTSRA